MNSSRRSLTAMERNDDLLRNTHHCLTKDKSQWSGTADGDAPFNFIVAPKREAGSQGGFLREKKEGTLMLSTVLYIQKDGFSSLEEVQIHGRKL